MTSEIEEELNKTEDYKTAIIEIKKEIENTGNSYNVETLLSNLEQKEEIIGIGSLNGLKKRKNISTY